MNWHETYETAYEACDARALTIDEKIAVVCEALDRYAKTTGYRSLEVRWLASRSIINEREFAATCRSHMAEINELLGTNYAYGKAHYDASGAGPFGRHGGGRKGVYAHPFLINATHNK